MTGVQTTMFLRWVARVWSVASVGLLCAFLFGEGLPPLTVKALLFPFGVILGLVLAWRYQRAGGVVATLSVILFYALHYSSLDSFPKGPWFFLIAAPGPLFILCGGLSAKRMSDPVARSGVSSHD